MIYNAAGRSISVFNKACGWLGDLSFRLLLSNNMVVNERFFLLYSFISNIFHSVLIKVPRPLSKVTGKLLL